MWWKERCGRCSLAVFARLFLSQGSASHLEATVLDQAKRLQMWVDGIAGGHSVVSKGLTGTWQLCQSWLSWLLTGRGRTESVLPPYLLPASSPEIPTVCLIDGCH